MAWVRYLMVGYLDLQGFFGTVMGSLVRACASGVLTAVYSSCVKCESSTALRKNPGHIDSSK